MARMGSLSAVAERSRAKADQPWQDTDVARVAYALFLRRGGVHGHDQEDWFEAERLVRERRGQASGRRSAGSQ
ncbi:MAG: DUF2934 domain-containing protein [Candidatus Omnitrophica bacterium]|nr:DUF2934 domain-containing protein [Candidatus Omnitrophota bacterium]